jgi:S1-C subfamily serine protease
VKDGYGSSHGSGSLVSPSLVLTNNHVVCDRKSDDSVEVWFPDGTIVDGKVIKTDKINDIAAIRIACSLKPYILLSGKTLQISETLTLHGYAGKYNYRSDTGVIGQFESPTRAGPNNFLRLDGAEARDGDSGGPLTLQDGTLGGVLFGSSGGRTSGVRISVVRKFVESLQ